MVHSNARRIDTLAEPRHSLEPIPGDRKAPQEVPSKLFNDPMQSSPADTIVHSNAPRRDGGDHFGIPAQLHKQAGSQSVVPEVDPLNCTGHMFEVNLKSCGSRPLQMTLQDLQVSYDLDDLMTIIAEPDDLVTKNNIADPAVLPNRAVLYPQPANLLHS